VHLIIFTDLDGSLLNHGDYSHAEAMPALARVKSSGIPLVMTTSKTRREVELLQREMGLREPFIVENGGGIFFPAGYGELSLAEYEARGDYRVVVLGTAYARIRNFLERVRPQFGARGFGDMTPAEISELTGLSLEQSALAAEREFTEPFLLEQPEDLERFTDAAAREGLQVTRGGRFLHLIGRGQDKGRHSLLPGAV
jgi:mannosyl-3-phosphoglycerate phosphatase